MGDALEHETFSCCENYGGADFSKIDFKKLDLCVLSYVDCCDQNLWLSVAAIILLPAFYSMMSSLQYSPFPMSVMSRSTYVEIVTFCVSVVKLYKFHQMMVSQPTWEAIQVSWILYTGCTLLSLGIFIFTLCLLRFGFWDTFVRWDFSEASPGSSVQFDSRHLQPASIPLKYRDLPVVFRTGHFFTCMGYSLMCASQAGLLLTVLQAIAYSYCFHGL